MAPTIDGDVELAEQAIDLLPAKKVSAFSVAALAPGLGLRLAAVGAPLNGTFEIGSINKAITGMLYADAVDRGEVSGSTELREVFDLGLTPAGSVTLDELSQHRSGLRDDVLNPLQRARVILDLLRARNPYHGDVEDLVRKLRKARLTAPVPTYSNLGFAALGHAVAQRTGLNYAELLDRSFPGLDKRGSHPVQGRDEAGRSQEPWDDLEFYPAGGISTDIGAMGDYAGSLLDGSAPGMSALTPTARFDSGTHIGAGWLTSQVDGHTLTWHNGATGGFSSWIGLDRPAKRAVVLLGATSHPMDTTGERLLLA
ncbi:serine hydrolase domain-containing protein [Corynebacterium doosanense]|uniref:Beta-lactamase n=1 Tax=Corynebacterium doosanense CAU 212 = DSM 45436 TaxID=558173 RepID=A0A097IIA1_9CORY|nr:serine hydrolase domain-containing protein [Corynebacterium doosanense]AIT61859.1 beta-lactamase [Corynebacterium doosanense CAU 212 = DSM 45436]